jgi:hypothetical protein
LASRSSSSVIATIGPSGDSARESCRACTAAGKSASRGTLLAAHRAAAARSHVAFASGRDRRTPRSAASLRTAASVPLPGTKRRGAPKCQSGHASKAAFANAATLSSTTAWTSGNRRQQ